MTDFETKRVKVAGMDFYIRPDTSDMLVLREVFVANEYRVPAKMNGLVLDIGANIGAFSIRAAGAGATVYAYEPESENVHMAIANFRLHGVGPNLNPVAVWSNDEGVWITPAQGNTSSGETGHEQVGDVWVASTTLNTILEDHLNGEEVEMLKMDVEGAEISIIEAVDTLRLQRVKRIAMEYHGQTPEFGDMIRKLSGVFDLEIVGHPYPGENSGGMLYGVHKS